MLDRNDEDDDDSWDFGTVKQVPAQTKPALQIHNTSSQYSINNYNNKENIYQQPSPSQQFSNNRNSALLQQQQQQQHMVHSSTSSRINEVTVSFDNQKAKKLTHSPLDENAAVKLSA